MVPPKAVPFFFAFPDGVFDYVCAECNALCCRGQGFGGNIQREMGFLLKTYPELSAMVTNRQRDLIDVSTPLGRCFFLQDDNRCRIQAEHGASRKPGVCLVFPFNRFTRIGTSVVVTPHFMCPLRIHVPARPGQCSGTHAEIEATLRDSGLIDARHVEWYLSPARLPAGESAATVLEREAALRSLASQALGQARFSDLLLAAGGQQQELADIADRMAALLAWNAAPVSPARDRMDDILIALAQPLLIEQTILSRQHALRVLAAGERLLRSVFTPAMPPPQPQAIFGVLQQALPLLRLLTGTEEKPSLPGKTPEAPFGHPDLVFAHVVLFRELEKTGPLAALENACKRLTSAADRSAIANHLARTLNPQ